MTSLRTATFATVGVAAIVAVGSATLAAGPQAGSATVPDESLAATGSQIFQVNCAECHTLGKDGDQLNGPNLSGLMGAKAAMKPDFPYSDALKAANITWNDEALDKWLASPSAMVPDNMMGFVGLPRKEDRQAVIAFLKKRTATE